MTFVVRWDGVHETWRADKELVVVAVSEPAAEARADERSRDCSERPITVNQSESKHVS